MNFRLSTFNLTRNTLHIINHTIITDQTQRQKFRDDEFLSSYELSKGNLSYI